MTKKKVKLELGEEVGTGVPTCRKVGTGEVGTRLGEMAAQLGTREYAAKIAGVHVDTLYRWIGGDSKAAFLPIARLAQAAGKSLDWVATGEERVESSRSCEAVDVGMLAAALAAVELSRMDLPTERKVKLVAAIYALFAKEGRVLDAQAVRQVVDSLII